MRHAILRISGTFGSGKTTAARDFLKYPHDPLVRNGKTMGYRIDVSSAGVTEPVFLIGSYANVCGGCDTIPTQDEIVTRVMKAHPYGHVLMEGALISSAGPGGALTIAAQPTGCAVYTFLDTPLEECIERVEGRRAERGKNTEPLDPKNLIVKFNGVATLYKKLKGLDGYDARLLDHTNIHPQLLDIFREFEAS